MAIEDVQNLASMLLYGSPETRRRTAERLSRHGGQELWALLVGTICSREPWLLRARCLEVLGLAAANADRQTAEEILRALLGALARENAPILEVAADETVSSGSGETTLPDGQPA